MNPENPQKNSDPSCRNGSRLIRPAVRIPGLISRSRGPGATSLLDRIGARIRGTFGDIGPRNEGLF